MIFDLYFFSPNTEKEQTPDTPILYLDSTLIKLDQRFRWTQAIKQFCNIGSGRQCWPISRSSVVDNFN